MGCLCMELYLEQLKKRYVGANRVTKTLILDEFCSNSGFHRKHAIRLLPKKLRKRTAVKKAAEDKKISMPPEPCEPISMPPVYKHATRALRALFYKNFSGIIFASAEK